MSNLSSKKVQDIYSLYEGMYQKEEILTEEQVNELIAIEWYNALVEEGIIDGELITENPAANPGLWGKLGSAITSGGPKIMNALRKVTGFGLGKDVGGKRRIVTAGAGTATLIDPQKAAQQVGGVAQGTATATRGAVTGALDALSQKQKEKEAAASDPRAYIDPSTGTIKYR